MFSLNLQVNLDKKISFFTASHSSQFPEGSLLTHTDSHTLGLESLVSKADQLHFLSGFFFFFLKVSQLGFCWEEVVLVRFLLLCRNPFSSFESQWTNQWWGRRRRKNVHGLPFQCFWNLYYEHVLSIDKIKRSHSFKEVKAEDDWESLTGLFQMSDNCKQSARNCSQTESQVTTLKPESSRSTPHNPTTTPPPPATAS